jgi:hypothetical protein
MLQIIIVVININIVINIIINFFVRRTIYLRTDPDTRPAIVR